MVFSGGSGWGWTVGLFLFCLLLLLVDLSCLVDETELHNSNKHLLAGLRERANEFVPPRRFGRAYLQSISLSLCWFRITLADFTASILLLLLLLQLSAAVCVRNTRRAFKHFYLNFWVCYFGFSKNTKPIIIVIVNSCGHFTSQTFLSNRHHTTRAHSQWNTHLIVVFFHFFFSLAHVDDFSFCLAFVFFFHTLSGCFRLFFNFIWTKLSLSILFYLFFFWILCVFQFGKFEQVRDPDALQYAHCVWKSNKFTH